MNFYRQSIALFGIVMPAFAAAFLIGLGFVAKSQIFSSFKNKQGLFKTYQTDFNKSQEVETAIVRQREHVERWNTILAEESSSAVNTHLRTIAGILPPKEFQKTAFERTAGSGGIRYDERPTLVSAQDYFPWHLSNHATCVFRAGNTYAAAPASGTAYRAEFQPAESLSLLNVQVTYTAWEN